MQAYQGLRLRWLDILRCGKLSTWTLVFRARDRRYVNKCAVARVWAIRHVDKRRRWLGWLLHESGLWARISLRLIGYGYEGNASKQRAERDRAIGEFPSCAYVRALFDLGDFVRIFPYSYGEGFHLDAPGRLWVVRCKLLSC